MTPRELRRILLVILCALLGIGTVAVYSSSATVSSTLYGGSGRFVSHHLVAIACGLLLGLGCLMISTAQLRRWARWLLPVSLLLLVLVRVWGHEIGGAVRWFRIGRWSIQPSEFAQLVLILYLADLLARRVGRIQEFQRGLLPPLVVTGVMSGLVLLQPDFGTAILMGASAFILLYVAKAKWQHLAGLLSLAALVLVVLIAGAAYRRARIMAFLNPWSDPQGGGYQILQSYIALASGGVVGLGVGASVQKLFFLPSAHTDFIFALIGEELGLIGTTAVLGLFALFLLCGCKIALAAQDPFHKYLVCGLVAMLGLEAIVNIAIVTGLLPTKGLPLPFISYGGSSMVMNLVACALIFKVSHDGEHLHA